MNCVRTKAPRFIREQQKKKKRKTSLYVILLFTFLTNVEAFAHANTLTGMLTHGVSEKIIQRQKILSINGSEIYTLNSRLLHTKEARENPYH